MNVVHCDCCGSRIGPGAAARGSWTSVPETYTIIGNSKLDIKLVPTRTKVTGPTGGGRDQVDLCASCMEILDARLDAARSVLRGS